METFSERLRWARAASGLSARGLGVAARLSSRHVWVLENDGHDNPALKTIVALARALGVKVGWLANGEGRRPAAKHVRVAAQASFLTGEAEVRARAA